MEYLEPSFHHFQQHHDQFPSGGISSYSDSQQNIHNYSMAQQSSTMMSLPNSTTKANETKPRLGKDEVEILEREFKRNPKPSTQTKRQFAEDMGVELARINNWFQNRRAKRKQEKKQEAYEAGQAQDAVAYSEPSSPDYFNGSGFFADNHLLHMQQPTVPYGLMTGPPPATAPYNPQYTDPSTASMESLQRTMAAAQAASQQQDFGGAFSGQDEVLTTFGGPLLHNSSKDDRAHFPSADGLTRSDGNHGYSYEYAFPRTLYSTSNQLMDEPQHSPTLHQTLTTLHTYSRPSGTDANVPHLLATFPSQLLPSQSHDRLSSHPQDASDSQSPEDSSDGSTVAIGFKYDIAEPDDSSKSPPAPSIPFRSPPPPMDIASRRKKVHVKPAALTADTLRGRPSVGPRTASHSENFRRMSDSPISSPMRRIASAGGNRSVVSGRVNKSGVESAQRSPMNVNVFADARALVEHNYHTTRQPPCLTAGSSLTSSLAPPTPMSPREKETNLVKREGTRSTASPVDSGMSFVFNAGVPGCFTSMEGDHNLASPPETPQAHSAIHHLANGWPSAVEFQDKQWHFEVPDEPLYTPARDAFPIELQMPQPSYLSSLSQPVTPAYGHFSPSYVFGNDSPQYKNDSPQYTISTQSCSEYSFPDAQSHYAGGMLPTSPMTKQKTFQFSNSTAADFSEK